MIKINALSEARDQLWAEARDRYLAQECWWLNTKELTDDAEEQQDQRYQADAWQEEIEDYVIGRSSISIEEILKGVFGLTVDRWGQIEQNRAARCMRKMGWSRVQVRDGKKRKWVYRREVDVDTSC
jgi:predicted P-loop ATPase